MCCIFFFFFGATTKVASLLKSTTKELIENSERTWSLTGKPYFLKKVKTDILHPYKNKKRLVKSLRKTQEEKASSATTFLRQLTNFTQNLL